MENIKGQNTNFIIITENISYDSLYVYGFDNKKNKKIFKGSKINSKWHFSIPDSIMSILNTYSVTPKLFNASNKTAYSTSHFMKEDKDTLRAELLVFDKRYPIINLKYQKTNLDKSSFLIQEHDSLIRVNGYIQEDIFSITLPRDSESYILMKYSDFSSFAKYDYKSCVTRYKSTTKQFPNSYYLMYKLHSKVGLYNSMKDVQGIYNNFNANIKTSYYGRKVLSFLGDTIFQNMLLVNDVTQQKEYIINDSSKYNIIVFSASWCAPCRKQIPLLKSLYHKATQELNMCYVSLDQKSTIAVWRRLIHDENIPWRSLGSFEKYEEVRERYHIAGPCILLVSPNMKMKKIEINNIDDIYNITRLLKKNQI